MGNALHAAGEFGVVVDGIQTDKGERVESKVEVDVRVGAAGGEGEDVQDGRRGGDEMFCAVSARFSLSTSGLRLPLRTAVILVVVSRCIQLGASSRRVCGALERPFAKAISFSDGLQISLLRFSSRAQLLWNVYAVRLVLIVTKGDLSFSAVRNTCLCSVNLWCREVSL